MEEVLFPYTDFRMSYTFWFVSGPRQESQGVCELFIGLSGDRVPGSQPIRVPLPARFVFPMVGRMCCF